MQHSTTIQQLGEGAVQAVCSRRDLESRMRGHVLGRGELIAIYQRG